MTGLDWVLLATVGMLVVAVVVLARASNTWYSRANTFKKYWEEELNSHRDTGHELSNLQWRYQTLQREYDEVAELDEAEDYVRKSLGYPPDEDEDESKETA